MKNEWISIRLTETEKAALVKLKQQTGLSMTEIIRLGISKITSKDLPSMRID